MLRIFPPAASTAPVALIEKRLGLPDAALTIPFERVNGARQQFCFENVRDVIAQRGGSIVYGWLIWQHEEIFIEAEHHSIWQKPSGEWVCITPQSPPEKSITFIPDPSRTFDFDARRLTKNVRVALISDSRLTKIFQIADQQTDLFNSAQRLNATHVELSVEDANRHFQLEMEKAALMHAVVQSRQPTPTTGVKVGRNEPCPCGSGKKFKKCHGA